MFRKVMLLVLFLFSSGMFAQGIVIDKGWEVKSRQNPQSEVRPDGLLLRLYSPVFNNTLDHEVSLISVDATWLNPVTVGLDLSGIFRYDDGYEERIDLEIPAKTKDYLLQYKPAYWKGRVLKRIEFRHGSSGSEVKIKEVRIFPENTPPVFLDQNALGSAQFITPKPPKYRVVAFGWDTKEADLPYLKGLKSNRIRLVGAKVSAQPKVEMGMQAVLKDAKGNTIKSFEVNLDGKVQEFSYEFKGIDMTKVDKVMFKATGSGSWGSIRRIIVEGEAPPPTVAKCDGVAPINKELEKVIDALKKESISNDSLMKLLQVLKMYKELER